MKAPDRHIPFQAVAWTVAALLVSAAPHLTAMPAWLAGIILLATAWRLAAAHHGWKPPPAWLRITLTLIAVGLVMVGIGGWGRRLATTLLCLMLAAKMMEMFRIRDLRMVASVCFFLIATQFLFNERLVYLLYLFAGSVTALVALIHLHRLENAGAQAGPGVLPDNHQVLVRATMMLAAALPVALTLFMLFPRLAQPLWGLPDHVMDARSGLSDDMSPGSIANLFLDYSPAFRAEFSGEPPATDQRYWRGPVMWHFDGDTWHRSDFLSQQPARTVPDGPDSLDYRIQLEPHERRWLFALDYPLEAPDEARIALDYQMINRRPVTTLTQYEVTSNPDFVDMRELPRNIRQAALRLPDDRNPRTHERARELRSRHADDSDLIVEVLQWFREEAFHYSLETPLTGRHGTDEFLFDLRVGYCEHYASAFAVLMRAAGIPTRIVTGYQGGHWQPGGEYLLVRQSDAHAWTEVWLEDRGWTRVDPTAAVSPARIDRGAEGALGQSRHFLDMTWVRDLRNRYDRIQHLWNRWVLGFDAARQQRFLRAMGLPEMTPLRIGLLMVLGSAVVIMLVALALLRSPRQRTDPLQRAWFRLLGRLRRAGYVKWPGETPMEFIHRVADGMENGGESLIRLGQLYCRARYGRDETRAASAFIDTARQYNI